MVTTENIKNWIEAGLSNSNVQVTGDGHHFEARVICPSFAGLSLIERHRMVYDALGAKMQKAI